MLLTVTPLVAVSPKMTIFYNSESPTHPLPFPLYTLIGHCFAKMFDWGSRRGPILELQRIPRVIQLNMLRVSRIPKCIIVNDVFNNWSQQIFVIVVIIEHKIWQCLIKKTNLLFSKRITCLLKYEKKRKTEKHQLFQDKSCGKILAYIDPINTGCLIV